MRVARSADMEGVSQIEEWRAVVAFDPAYWRERHADLHPAQEEPYYDKILADMAAFRLSQDHWLPHSIWTHLPISPSSTWLPADP